VCTHRFSQSTSNSRGCSTAGGERRIGRRNDSGFVLVERLRAGTSDPAAVALRGWTSNRFEVVGARFTACAGLISDAKRFAKLAPHSGPTRAADTAAREAPRLRLGSERVARWVSFLEKTASRVPRMSIRFHRTPPSGPRAKLQGNRSRERCGARTPEGASARTWRPKDDVRAGRCARSAPKLVIAIAAEDGLIRSNANVPPNAASSGRFRYDGTRTPLDHHPGQAYLGFENHGSSAAFASIMLDKPNPRIRRQLTLHATSCGQKNSAQGKARCTSQGTSHRNYGRSHTLLLNHVAPLGSVPRPR